MRSAMASILRPAGRAAGSRRAVLRYPSLAVIIAVVVALLVAVVYRAGPARADNPPGNTYVALGDSYSSGEGAPPYLTSSCDRSASSWVTGFAADLGAGVGYANNACAGATTSDVVNQGQLNSLGPNTQLVTITVGGNDMGFGPALTNCTTGVSCAGLDIAEPVRRATGDLARLVPADRGARPERHAARRLLPGHLAAG
ncbi:MAG: GDSL-type esterase/lipase family protein [Actinomycetota bacterium]|nr:GDSL-type esterase/lipase family protein [Actinomycetota bacterium]